MKTGKKKNYCRNESWTKKTMVEEDEKLNKVRIAQKKKKTQKKRAKNKKRFLRCSA